MRLLKAWIDRFGIVPLWMLMVTFFALLQVLIDLFRAWLDGNMIDQLYSVVGSGGMLFYCSSMVAASLVDVWMGDTLDRVKRRWFIFVYAFIPVVIFAMIAVWYSHISDLHRENKLGAGYVSSEQQLSAHLIFVGVCMVFTVIAKFQSTPPQQNG